MNEAGGALIVIALIAIAVSVTVVGMGVSKKCPTCGKLFALQEQGRTLLGSRATTVTEQREVKNEQGEVVGTVDVDVPAVARDYKVSYKCKYCGNVQNKAKTEVS